MTNPKVSPAKIGASNNYAINWRKLMTFDVRIKAITAGIGCAYAEYATYDNGQSAGVSQTTLIALFGTDNKTIKRHVGTLEELGYMQFTHTDTYGVNFYNLLVPAEIHVDENNAVRTPWPEFHVVVDRKGNVKARQADAPGKQDWKAKPVEKVNVAKSLAEAKAKKAQQPVSEPQEAKQGAEVKEPETEPQKPVQPAKPSSTKSALAFHVEQEQAEVVTMLNGEQDKEVKQAAWDLFNAEDWEPELTGTKRAFRARMHAGTVIEDKRKAEAAKAFAATH
ncbi:hypothetical protein ABZ119_25995 [Streptomyces sp. NPDC006288]|uniref:hypothetical protein n=1 Tax=Streptomyces sp. NPDC006288 TaxID=3156743 RepID=UPI0033BED698